MYPLVRELAGDGIPVTVTCRVLRIARQPYYRGLKNPVSDRRLAEAHLANAIFDAHRDDPEFGYRFLADEARQAGHRVGDRTVWRICQDNGWWSAFGKPLPTAERLWSTVEVAAYLGVPVKTMHKWRYVREGPPSFKVGRHLRYDPDAVRRWLVEQCASERSA